MFCFILFRRQSREDNFSLNAYLLNYLYMESYYDIERHLAKNSTHTILHISVNIKFI